MVCVEDPAFTRDYHDPEKRSIANGITVEFADGTKLDEVVVEYPLGHKRRRAEGIPLLEKKFVTNLGRRFPAKQSEAILQASLERSVLERMPVNEYVDLYTTAQAGGP
jgi:2-methylcitrate dehydratase